MKLRNYLFVYLLSVLFSGYLFAQLSPGDLTKAHSKFEGMSNCTRCHTLGKKVENNKCLSCHTEIQKLQSAKKGYHASNEVQGKECEKCHSEHHGRNFQIVRFDKKKFNHDNAGWKLTGKHSSTDCEKCHTGKNIKNKVSQKSGFSYLGLTQECYKCHQDAHAGTVGNNCANCHGTDAFKPVRSFDHSKTSFPLTGMHQNQTCEKCHQKSSGSGSSVINFSANSFSNCTPCHKDVHNNKFGTDCKKCHTTAGFSKIISGVFDHAKTNFPLIGLHGTVACASCHGQKGGLKPKHQQCIDCHKDKHNGRFVEANGVLKDCKLCHTEKGFTPSLYSIEMHNTSPFKLSGSHLSIPCATCHKGTADWSFTKQHKRCTDCHKNIHGNEVTGKYLGDNECEKCHNNNSWNEITFDHANTGFVLSGRHTVAACTKCHSDSLRSSWKFASLNTQCVQCHKDAHFGQFEKNSTTDCARCHGFENWKPVKFDHATTRFMLTGAHEKVACEKCHKKVVNDITAYTLYRIKDFKCSNCHS